MKILWIFCFVGLAFGSNFPLYLTKLLENPDRNISAIQKSAFVHHEELRDLISYSGYFTVNKEYDSNLFFWYFKVKVSTANPNF